MSLLDKLIFMNFVDMQHIIMATSNVMSKERYAVTMFVNMIYFTVSYN